MKQALVTIPYPATFTCNIEDTMTYAHILPWRFKRSIIRNLYNSDFDSNYVAFYFLLWIETMLVRATYISSFPVDQRAEAYELSESGFCL
jgi:hypothetical protein